LSVAMTDPSSKNYLEAVMSVKAVYDAVKDL
jgi:hypothetical protein